MIEKGKVTKYEVIVIGAGPAGLGAASILQQSNTPYLVLEGRLRVGGRAHSIQIDDVRVDLGAWWLHSYTQANPIKKYVQKHSIKLYPQLKQRLLYDGEQCRLFSEEIIKKCQVYHDDYFQISRIEASIHENDISVQEATKEKFAEKWITMTPEQRRCTQLLLNVTQRHQSSSLSQLSAKNFDFLKEEIINERPINGYAHLFRKIAQNLNIQLNRKVISIDTSQKQIKIKCLDGSVYNCNKVIVSIPLGVLKTKNVQFIPELPQSHRNSIQKLGYGLMNKIYLSFSQQFWGESDWISIGFNQQGKFPHFFNYSSKDRFILVCFISGDIARQYEQKSDGEVVEQLVENLKKIFNAQHVILREAYVTKWGQDQFTYGSYSAFHVGSSAEDSFALRKPINEKLWFVGEHCYGEHIGTAHGALQTGEWAAEHIIKLLNKDKRE